MNESTLLTLLKVLRGQHLKIRNLGTSNQALQHVVAQATAMTLPDVVSQMEKFAQIAATEADTQELQQIDALIAALEDGQIHVSIERIGDN